MLVLLPTIIHKPRLVRTFRQIIKFQNVFNGEIGLRFGHDLRHELELFGKGGQGGEDIRQSSYRFDGKHIEVVAIDKEKCWRKRLKKQKARLAEIERAQTFYRAPELSILQYIVIQ